MEESTTLILLGLAVFALTYPGPSRLTLSARATLVDVLLSWGTTMALLIAAGWVTGYVRIFPLDVVLTWLAVTPAALGQALDLQGLAGAGPRYHTGAG